MGKKIKFGDIEIQRQKFNENRGHISIKSINNCKTVVFNEISFGKMGFKCFIVYKDAKKVRPFLTSTRTPGDVP